MLIFQLCNYLIRDGPVVLSDHNACLIYDEFIIIGKVIIILKYFEKDKNKLTELLYYS
jgi:hypothetical protein